jgi:hypothetical protein
VVEVSSPAGGLQPKEAAAILSCRPRIVDFEEPLF